MADRRALIVLTLIALAFDAPPPHAAEAITAGRTSLAVDNEPPHCRAGGPYYGDTGLAVDFDGTGSHDDDGWIVDYQWSFGDGGTGAGALTSHSYTSAGTYTVTLAVTDNLGATSECNTDALVGEFTVIEGACAPLGDDGVGRGAAWGDLEGDGDLDLLLVNDGQPDRLFRNDGLDCFEEVAAELGIADPGAGRAGVWGDYDGDGDLDLYLAKDGPNRLFRNDGAGFTDVSAGPIADPGEGQGAAWGDADLDGSLDIMLVNAGPNALLRNEGNGTFTDVSTSLLRDRGSHSVAWSDVDEDGDLDIGMAGDDTGVLLLSAGGGEYIDATPDHLDQPCNAIAFGEINVDDAIDIYISRDGPNRLLRGRGDGTFFNEGWGPMLDGYDGSGIAWTDVDLNGYQDIYVANSDYRNRLVRNDAGTYHLATPPSLALDDSVHTTAVACADYDGDGDEDIYIVNANAANRLVRNDIDSPHHWLQLQLVAWSNATAVGARVETWVTGYCLLHEVSGGTGLASQSAPIVTVGIGLNEHIDRVDVRWPGGGNYTLFEPPLDRLILIEEEAPGAVGPGMPGVAGSIMLTVSPNPFNPWTSIRWTVPGGSDMRLDLLDVTGQHVRQLAAGPSTTGSGTIAWDGRDSHGAEVASGTYFLRLEARDRVAVRKVVLLR